MQATQQAAGLRFEGGFLGAGEVGPRDIEGDAGDAGLDEEGAALYLHSSSFGKLPGYSIYYR